MPDLIEISAFAKRKVFTRAECIKYFLTASTLRFLFPTLKVTTIWRGASIQILTQTIPLKKGKRSINWERWRDYDQQKLFKYALSLLYEIYSPFFTSCQQRKHLDFGRGERARICFPTLANWCAQHCYGVCNNSNQPPTEMFLLRSTY